VIEDRFGPFDQGPGGQFRLTGRAKLAHQQQVEGGVQNAGDGQGHRHAATRQRINDGVGHRLAPEPPGKGFARFGSVGKHRSTRTRIIATYLRL